MILIEVASDCGQDQSSWRLWAKLANRVSPQSEIYASHVRKLNPGQLSCL